MAAKNLNKGDTVTWKSSGGKVTGKVVSETTNRSKIKTHTVAASSSNPEYIVQSNKTGTRAAHKASALKKS